ncbi:replication termination factor 2 [Leguminivora glycinivorella]|uniref:replication termination factor 2 n=1 Tax=Leguminivora glycinivorella TaxID=1035111 RepID=UPI00200E22C9|nr:replication termination factor 2 [Leguminivora glycinivorella]
MGCDGGTIPRRDELVRMKKKPEQKDKDAERSFKWRNCALSQQPLQEPVVACGLGRLYSKSSVLEALLDKETKPESISHIKNMKDIKDLKLVKNPAYVATEHTDGAVGDSSPYICPISGIEMSGKFRFVFLWSCGCVLAERALKEVKQHLCHMCQAPFTDNDVIILNGTEEDIELLKTKMATRVANRKTKKSKADKHIKTEATSSCTVTSDASSTSTSTEIKTEVKEEPEAGSSQAVKKEIETIPLSLPKYNPNKVPRGHLGSQKRAFGSNDLVQDPSYKKTKKDYSIAKDPQSSEVYKSLFTSHTSDQNQQRAHWVTYNPFYN